MNKKEWGVKFLLILGIIGVLSSVPFPYWKIKVVAPQYPRGLQMTIYVNKLAGDVQEMDTLNHYIGMRKVGDAAKFERRYAVPGLIFLSSLLVAAVFYRGRFYSFLCLPALAYPVIFAFDLYYWLRDSGLNLDPKAPLNRSIKPFIPPLFGDGKIAQFTAHASFEAGYFLILAAAFLVLAACFLRSRKYV